jgi:hypothetical protein
MKTTQLAVALIGLITIFAGVFGLVPPLLNAKDTFMNALGIAIILAVILAAVLVVYDRAMKQQTTQQTPKKGKGK